jgi:hypothetical protein
MASGKKKLRLRSVASAEAGVNDTIAVGDSITSAGHEEMLNSSTSERRYWRDPSSGIQREIWRPGKLFLRHIVCVLTDWCIGDGDGDVEHDHHDRLGELAPLEKRWRLYQVSVPVEESVSAFNSGNAHIQCL